MNTQPPLLPETTFKPLSATRLESMITHAMSHQQLPRENNVIAFRRPWFFATGMAAMAASVMLTFMLTPQYTPVATSGNLTNTALTADVSDMLLLESLDS